MKFRAFALAGCAALALIVAACGSSSDNSTSSSSTSGSAPAKGKPIKVGLVTDIGGLNDRSFNHLAYVGLQRAQKELGIKGRVLTSKSAADYVPNLTTLAQQQYDLIIPVGFLMADATAAVAKQVPNGKFSIVDFPAAALKGKPANVEGLLFKEQEAGYLAGYLAGLYAKDNNVKTISSVGGQQIPPVDHHSPGTPRGPPSPAARAGGGRGAPPGEQAPTGVPRGFGAPGKGKGGGADQNR